MKKLIQQWHQIVQHADTQLLKEILDDEIVMHSPVVFRPLSGRAIVEFYLQAAFHTLVNDSFQYVREVVGEKDAILEFTVEIDGVFINGVDMIKFNENGKIIDFKVMLRPLKAVNLIHQKMGEMLEQMKG
ncbi:MAG: hypothetical protein MK226_08430 [Saprospiraceae bacterium]|nr:hypothetical protein [Saprospiraceae bacterium]